jgi:PIN domain nuclease of toxin-antitoxin system
VESGFEELPVRLAHADVVRGLPHHHRDPFDRILVAQAIAERLTLVTRDRELAAYDVKVLAA